jgi:RNA polymerase sigma-70 factor (ECF subfamily)
MEEILRTYGDMVYRVALTHTKTREDAEDVSQEVFLLYVRKQPEFNDDEHAKAWFLRVTLRFCGKVRLSQARRPTSELHENIQAPDTAADSDVWPAFLSLPKKYRTAVYLFYYERYSIREMAGILDVTQSAVKKRLERAREKLRIMMGEGFDE